MKKARTIVNWPPRIGYFRYRRRRKARLYRVVRKYYFKIFSKSQLKLYSKIGLKTLIL